MALGKILIVEGIVVIVMLGAFLGFTSIIMDQAMQNTNNMITGMMTGNINQMESSVGETDSYMRSLGKTSSNFLDNVFLEAELNAEDNQKVLLQKAREKLKEMKAEFADAEDIVELEYYLNQLEQ